MRKYTDISKGGTCFGEVCCLFLRSFSWATLGLVITIGKIFPPETFLFSFQIYAPRQYIYRTFSLISTYKETLAWGH